MQYILIALLSAVLFGASTPIGKLLLYSLPPFQLAGLLYIGAAIGVLPFSIRQRNAKEIHRIGKRNILRLIGAISFGGVAGPVILLFGLQKAPAASVAMWLNLELIATAILGCLLFRENLGGYGWAGVIGTIGASVMLSWRGGTIGIVALLLVAAAGICWGIDNHLTALIDGITPTQSTFWKGAIAGGTNLIISVILEPYGKAVWILASGIIVGVFSYGFSISLYILAAQNLGATRSQMIFASAPFFGVALSIILLNESISAIQAAAAAILVFSLTLLLRDQHSHSHTHEPLHHKHRHRHDDGHHDHVHAEDEAPVYHSHWHKHEPTTHAHPHWPDIHHRHRH